MSIREKIIEIMSANSNVDNIKEYLHNNDDLTQLNMNSISFIKMVVNLESEFGFEFEEEALDYKKFSSLKLLCGYVEEQMQMNNIVYSPNMKKNEEMSIRNGLVNILSRYIEDEVIKHPDFNDLSSLNISMQIMQSILLDIQERYIITLNEDIILQKELFQFNNLCKYVLYNQKGITV